MKEREILSDVSEAVNLLETYHLSSLIWRFESCPLDEIKHYMPKGKEEFVILCHRDDKHIPFRMVFDSGFSDVEDVESNYIQLNFHEEYHLFIILNPENDVDQT